MLREYKLIIEASEPQFPKKEPLLVGGGVGGTASILKANSKIFLVALPHGCPLPR